jgi:NAD(P)-dependent dehydrogenase (short-subunit alcohol dehydrogenase family)
MSKTWTVAEIPNQAGKRIIVTGANSGIGYHAALKLARKGAHVVLACRDPQKGEAALARLNTEAPGTHAELAILDLASLASVRDFAAAELAKRRSLHILINNAGVMAPPRRLETTEGFELQFGTNVLGHFALTALLLPALQQAAAESTHRPRIVTIASIAHKRGQLNFNDLQSEKHYSPMGAYQQSKLADLMFAFELERRLHAHSIPIMSIAAHPGVAHTPLFSKADYNPIEKAARTAIGHAIELFLNSGAEGALPTLYAATSPEAQGGGYYGPQGLLEARGERVGEAKVAPQARDTTAAAQLWASCEKLTGTNLL